MHDLCRPSSWIQPVVTCNTVAIYLALQITVIGLDLNTTVVALIQAVAGGIVDYRNISPRVIEVDIVDALQVTPYSISQLICTALFNLLIKVSTHKVRLRFFNDSAVIRDIHVETALVEA